VKEVDIPSLEPEHFAPAELAPSRQEDGEAVTLGDGLESGRDFRH
jgi:hypothetical protein